MAAHQTYELPSLPRTLSRSHASFGVKQFFQIPKRQALAVLNPRRCGFANIVASGWPIWNSYPNPIPIIYVMRLQGFVGTSCIQINYHGLFRKTIETVIYHYVSAVIYFSTFSRVTNVDNTIINYHPNHNFLQVIWLPFLVMASLWHCFTNINW